MAFHHIHIARAFLYYVLVIFSIVELGLDAARLHYTLHIPAGDPLNDGHDFYDPIVVELLVTSILTILWGIHAARVIQGRYEFGYITSITGEFLALFVLFIMWIVGAAIASTYWGNLTWCHEYKACRILTTLLAFSWMSWAFVFVLLILSLFLSMANNAWGEQMHGRWGPRASTYSANGVEEGAAWNSPPVTTRNGRRWAFW